MAIERSTKLIFAWHLGRRDGFNATVFVEEVERATRGRFQFTTDGFSAYPEAVSVLFEDREIDYAQQVKKYGPTQVERRHSPAKVVGVDVVPCCGNPTEDGIWTSHIDRANLTIRMPNRWMTRLTNAFSTKWDNHRAVLSLHFAVYNFGRPHGTLTKQADGETTTPAMAAGLTDRPWTLLELLQASTQE